MSESLAKYSFIPYVRLGLGNQITEPDTLGVYGAGNILERPEVEVSVTVKASNKISGQSVTQQVPKTVKIEGPGDVLGIQHNQIIRVHPARGVDNFETNNLVYIEFYEEDFPWRFTPAKPSGNNLRPWLSLIVLKEDEFIRNTQGGTPTPYITVAANALNSVFYPQTELHFFAHVHVLETLQDNITSAANAKSQLADTVSNNPDLAMSRIICPRKLAPETNYHVFLIPSYETGRLTGLGESTSGILAQQPSWNYSALGNSALKMPYYYSWNFKTSDAGDFESLVQLLETRTFPGKTGREMDMSDPGLGLKPTGNDAIALVEGALQTDSHTTQPWPIDEASLQEKLRGILNLNVTLQKELPTVPDCEFYSPNVIADPIVTPPIYGTWHAHVDVLTNKNDWIHQLNLHPSHRAAAGLGTRVVQEHQEEFMEMAWNQIGPINEANQRIIENEAVKRTADKLYRKSICKMDQFRLMNTIGKAMEVIPTDNNTTAKKTLTASRVPTAFRTGTFTRIANNFSQTALMNPEGNDGAQDIMNESLLMRTNADESSQMEVGTTATGDLVFKSAISPAPRRKVFEIQINPVMIKQAIDVIIDNPPPSFLGSLTDAIATIGQNFQPAQVIADLAPLFSDDQIKRATEILDGITARKMNDGVLTLDIKPSVYDMRVSSKYNSGDFDVTGGARNNISNVCFKKSYGVTELITLHYADVLESRRVFAYSFSTSFLNRAGDASLAYVKKAKGQLEEQSFRSKILDGFRPGKNYLRKLQAFVEADAANKGKPIMAYPRFPIPVYDYLKDVSPDFIIPNLSNIPENTISLMKPNKKFVEAFLAGMNHEFSRELLWREFPTDMRGSYFRHFWEYDNDPTNEMLPEPDESEADFYKRIIDFQDAAVDIRELHHWNGKLGENHFREFGLILLIKSDLFKKYPDTLVYAQKAKYKSGDGSKLPRELTDYHNPENVQWPIITGMIEPDVYFFGFKMSINAAKGNSVNKPGWFFVLRERPGQISFGLDDLSGSLEPPTEWNDLTWEHLTGNSAPGYLKINGAAFNPKTFNGVNWNFSSAQTAYILYQNPVLYAKHASVFL